MSIFKSSSCTDIRFEENTFRTAGTERHSTTRVGYNPELGLEGLIDDDRPGEIVCWNDMRSVFHSTMDIDGIEFCFYRKTNYQLEFVARWWHGLLILESVHPEVQVNEVYKTLDPQAKWFRFHRALGHYGLDTLMKTKAFYPDFQDLTMDSGSTIQECFDCGTGKDHKIPSRLRVGFHPEKHLKLSKEPGTQTTTGKPGQVARGYCLRWQ